MADSYASARKQTPGDYITDAFAGLLGYVPGYRDDPRRAYQMSKKLAGLLDTPEMLHQAGGLLATGARDGSAGGLLAGTGMAALGAMPMASKVAPLVKPLIKDAAKGIRAYHGSPHAFDKFDISKIGTGEGAQSYGHGLYFAENEGVAKGYRDTLSGEMFLTPSGELFDPTRDLKHVNTRAAFTNALRKPETFGDDPVAAAINRAQQIGRENPTYNMAQSDIAKLMAIQDRGGIQANPGHMYEVNIAADPAQFLDWDKPLGEMSPDVQQKLHDAMLAHKVDHAYQTGGQIYESARIVPGDYRNPAAASKTLSNAGIQGIKYLDQGSRAAKEGSRNYVVFNPDLVNIMRRYAMPVGATGAAAATLPSLLGPQSNQQGREY